MSQVLITLFFFTTTLFSNVHCMLKKWELEPMTISQNPELTVMRKKLDDLPIHSIVKKYPNIKIARQPTEDERTRRCCYFAFKAATGSHIPVNHYCSHETIDNYFYQTNNPQPLDLVPYTKNATSHAIRHFAVVKSVSDGHIVLQSKFGTIDAIINHEPSAVPKSYGDAFGFFTLKHPYRSDKKRLHREMANIPTLSSINDISDTEMDVFLILVWSSALLGMVFGYF
jgi:hypothetical protein